MLYITNLITVVHLTNLNNEQAVTLVIPSWKLAFMILFFLTTTIPDWKMIICNTIMLTIIRNSFNDCKCYAVCTGLYPQKITPLTSLTSNYILFVVIQCLFSTFFLCFHTLQIHVYSAMLWSFGRIAQSLCAFLCRKSMATVCYYKNLKIETSRWHNVLVTVKL